MSGSKKEEKTQLTYEKAFQELEEIVTALESNQAPLDETMELFERGQKLLRCCTELLEKAELRLKTLNELDVDDDESAGEIDL